MRAGPRTRSSIRRTSFGSRCWLFCSFRSCSRPARPSSLVDVVELVGFLRDDEEVERKEARPETRQRARRRVDRAQRRALADHVPDRGSESLDLLDRKARVGEELLERVHGEEPRMGEVEDPALSVVELAEQEARSEDDVRDVARAHVERPAGLEDGRNPPGALLRLPEML